MALNESNHSPSPLSSCTSTSDMTWDSSSPAVHEMERQAEKAAAAAHLDKTWGKMEQCWPVTSRIKEPQTQRKSEQKWNNAWQPHQDWGRSSWIMIIYQVSRISPLEENQKKNGTMLAGRINLVFAQSLSLLSRKPKVGFTGRRRTGVRWQCQTQETHLPHLTSRFEDFFLFNCK